MFVRLATLVAALLTSHCQAAEPAARATQRFVVRVPPKATVVAPQDVQLMHDGTDAPQRFPAQRWRVAGTYASGLTIDFSTDDAFRNQRIVDAQRDVSLGLTVGDSEGSGTWTVAVAQDNSHCATGDTTTLVRVESDGPGQADLLLDVLFLTGDRSALPAGDYALTVTATVSANP